MQNEGFTKHRLNTVTFLASRHLYFVVPFLCGSWGGIIFSLRWVAELAFWLTAELPPLCLS